MGAGHWADERANEDEMEGVADSDGSTTPTPPTRWPTPTPVPVMPTRGSKHMAMAMGTPRPASWYRLAAPPAFSGMAVTSVVEQVLAAIAGMERKLEEKVAALEGRMMEGMAAMTADTDGRAAGVLADAEEREKQLATKFLATEAIEGELGQRARWEIGRWEKLDGLMELRREDLRKVMGTVNGIATEIAEMRAASLASVATPAASAPEAMLGPAAAGDTWRSALKPVGVTCQVPTRALPVPEDMEGVVAMAPAPASSLPEDPIEEYSDMEGVEREGLFASHHAPGMGEPIATPGSAPKAWGE